MQPTLVISASCLRQQCFVMVVIFRVLENANFHNRVIKASKQFILKVIYDKEHRNIFTFQLGACISCFLESCPTLKYCNFCAFDSLEVRSLEKLLTVKQKLF